MDMTATDNVEDDDGDSDVSDVDDGICTLSSLLRIVTPVVSRTALERG